MVRLGEEATGAATGAGIGVIPVVVAVKSGGGTASGSQL
jgi:hypothetical protein